MPVDAIVRFSFQTNSGANQAANRALTGDPAPAPGTGAPFQKAGTAAYTCHNGIEAHIGKALADFGQALQQYAGEIDFVSVTVARR